MYFAHHLLPFWSQKVLPLVYDDSLSYYEFLCKLWRELALYIYSNDEALNTLALKVDELVEPIVVQDATIEGVWDTETDAFTITASTHTFDDLYDLMRVQTKPVIIKVIYRKANDPDANKYNTLLGAVGGLPTSFTTSSLIFTGLDIFYTNANTNYVPYPMQTFTWNRNETAALEVDETKAVTEATVQSLIQTALAGYATESYVDAQIVLAVAGLATKAYVDQQDGALQSQITSVSNSLANYFPLTGGRLDGPIRAPQMGLNGSNNIYPLPVITNADLGLDVNAPYHIPTYYKELLKWLCAHYSTAGNHVMFVGLSCPSDAELTVIHIYNPTQVDVNGYPRFAQVLCVYYNGVIQTFITSEYEFHYYQADRTEQPTADNPDLSAQQRSNEDVERTIVNLLQNERRIENERNQSAER